MPLIFATNKDHPHDIEISGVGVLGRQGNGGIPVERAAERAHELQDAKGKPLTGKRLETAAQEFADARGFTVRSLQKLDEGVEEKLRVQAGAFPRGRSIEDVAREASERDFGAIEAHAENPDAAPLDPADVPPQETAVLPQPADPAQ